jgi:hypothetical protein
MVSFDSGWLEPGESCVTAQRVRAAYRGERLVANLEAKWPARRFFMRGVGGSRRKGRRASWLFDAETLCHQKRLASVSIDSLTIGRAHQTTGPVVASFFEPLADLALTLDVAKEESDITIGYITIGFTNHERYRVARARVTMIGTSVQGELP